MNKLKSKLYRFMYGRYGTDTLSKVNLWAYAVVLIIYTVLRIVFAFALKGNTLAPTILSICYVVISAILVSLLFFRMFSKNIAKRRAENERFCGFFKLFAFYVFANGDSEMCAEKVAKMIERISGIFRKFRGGWRIFKMFLNIFFAFFHYFYIIHLNIKSSKTG